jgi:hypothetical protein
LLVVTVPSTLLNFCCIKFRPPNLCTGLRTAPSPDSAPTFSPITCAQLAFVASLQCFPRPPILNVSMAYSRILSILPSNLSILRCSRSPVDQYGPFLDMFVRPKTCTPSNYPQAQVVF